MCDSTIKWKHRWGGINTPSKVLAVLREDNIKTRQRAVMLYVCLYNWNDLNISGSVHIPVSYLKKLVNEHFKDV